MKRTIFLIITALLTAILIGQQFNTHESVISDDNFSHLNWPDFDKDNIATDETTMDIVETYQGAKISLVTVFEGKNLIVWLREEGKGIAFYNIYKETETDAYEKVHSQSINQLSVWIDEESDPKSGPSRYKLSITDTDGNESGLSEAHKTLYLSIDNETENGISLNWGKYEGIPFTSFIIKRGTSEDNVEPIDTVTDDNTSYSDNPPDGVYYYQIAIPLPEIISPANWFKSSAGPFSQVESNMEKKIKSSNNIYTHEKTNNIIIYPIPAKNELFIKTSELNYKYLEIIDLDGKQIFKSLNNKDEIVINTSNFSNGMYILQLYLDSEIISKKIMIKR